MRIIITRNICKALGIRLIFIMDQENRLRRSSKRDDDRVREFVEAVLVLTGSLNNESYSFWRYWSEYIERPRIQRRHSQALSPHKWNQSRWNVSKPPCLSGKTSEAQHQNVTTKTITFFGQTNCCPFSTRSLHCPGLACGVLHLGGCRVSIFSN
eukprot:PhF_6_TR35869/c0_g1_i1/m.52056